MNRTAGILLLGLGAIGVAGTAYHLATSRKRGISGAVRGILAEAASESAPRAGRHGRPFSPKKKAKVTEYVRKTMSIDERVAILRDVGHDSIKDPAVRKLALQITRHCRARDGMCEAKAIYDWVHKNIRYTGDVGPHHHGRGGPYEGIDVFQTAARTVEFGGGDCDDHSILVCALGIQNGFACRYRITGPSRANNDDWGHIYAMLGMPKTAPRRWISADTTLPSPNMFGREAPYGKKKDYDA